MPKQVPKFKNKVTEVSTEPVHFKGSKKFAGSKSRKSFGRKTK